MPRKCINVVLITLLLSTCCWSQQGTMWSGAHLDWYSINPAAAGFKKTFVASGVLRNQWNGLKGGAQTQQLMAHLPLYIANGGAGMRLHRDASGPIESFELTASYNYVQGTRFGLLSFGGELGWGQYTLDGAALRTPDGDYTTGVDHKDDRLPQISVSGGTPIFGVGVTWSGASWTAGAGWRRGALQNVVLAEDLYIYEVSDHFYGHIDYNFEQWEMLWKPFVMFYRGNGFAQWQTGIDLIFPSNIRANLSFRGYAERSQDAIIAGFGFRLNEHFQLHYAFDYLISRLNQVYSNNAHEFTLGYSLNKPIRTGLPPRIIYNPRF